MKFTVMTLFPEMVQKSLPFGVVGQALNKKIFSVDCVNPRDFTSDNHKSVDDRPYGGGDGMIMLTEPLAKSFESLGDKQSYHSIYLSPQGKPLTQSRVQELSNLKHLVLLCGRYGGVDQRVLNTCIDEEISIGDFIVSGGELPAVLLIDAVARFLPNVLGHEDSAYNDSFKNNLLEGPSFTRPQEWRGQKVPEIFLSGHHENIQKFKHKLSLYLTAQKRPDLLSEIQKSQFEKIKNEIEGLPLDEQSSLGIKTK